MKVTTRDVNILQQNIMKFVNEWINEHKTVVPRKKIIKRMEENGVKSYTTVNALKALVSKGYIRRAVTVSNGTFFVQLKSV